MQNGGDSREILEQIKLLELEAASLERKIPAVPFAPSTSNKKRDNITNEPLKNISQSPHQNDIPAIPSSYDQNAETPMTFEEIDMITTPFYDEERGFVLFFDYVTGIPFRGSMKTIELYCSLFSGSNSNSPVEVMKPFRSNLDQASYVTTAIMKTEKRIFDLKVNYIKVMENRTNFTMKNKIHRQQTTIEPSYKFDNTSS
jgi:hypothetical protein